MIITIVLYIVSSFFGAVATVVSSIFVLTPVGFQQGLSDILNGARPLNALLPMYPHPEMTGIVSQTGIMPLLGWLNLLASSAVIVYLLFMLMKLIARILPWNTEGE